MRKILLLGIAIVVTTLDSNAQGYAEEFRPKHLGVHISSLSGVGFSYLHDLSYWDNLKATAFFCYQPDDYSSNSIICDDNEARYSFGLEYQRDLWESKILRLHFLLGGSISNIAFKFTECNLGECDHLNRGIGLGLDFEIIPGMAFNFHRTYQYTTTYGNVIQTDHGYGWGMGITIHFSSE